MKALFSYESEVLASNNIAKQARLENTFSQVKPDELRWMITPNASVKALPLSTQRNRLRRRWAAALRESLKRKGLDNRGRRLASQMHMPHTPELLGTLEIVIYEGYGFEELTEELVFQTDRIIECVARARQATKRISFQDREMRDPHVKRWH